MIKIKPRDLTHKDIGRRVSYLGPPFGVIANYTNFKGHVEVVFEDGTGIELNGDDVLEYDDSAEVKLDSSELKALIAHHPDAKKYRDELDDFTRQRKYSVTWSTFEKEPIAPKESKRLLRLRALLDEIERT